MLFKNFSLGISYRYSYFELNRKSFTTDVNGQLDSHFAGLTTAISKPINDKLFFKYGISFGKNQVLKKATGFENLNSPNYNNFISPFLVYSCMMNLLAQLVYLSIYLTQIIFTISI